MFTNDDLVDALKVAASDVSSVLEKLGKISKNNISNGKQGTNLIIV